MKKREEKKHEKYKQTYWWWIGVNRLGNNQNNRSINRIARKLPTPIINAMNG